jgi:hypothetical protein
LLYAIKNNRIQELLDEGVAIIDKGDKLAMGTIGRHVINSDTFGGTFIESIIGNEEGLFSDVSNADITLKMREHARQQVPLQWVGEFLEALGRSLRKVIDNHPASRFFSSTEIVSVHTGYEDGKIRVRALRKGLEGEDEIEFIVDKLVLAMGGKQSYEHVLSQKIGDRLSLAPYREKMLLTGHALTEAGIEEMRNRLEGSANKKVVIIGSSHSAFSSAWCLLNKVKADFNPKDITIVHRSKLKLFYATAEEAIHDGYNDFTEQDICPLTKRVYRLSGLRFDSKDLLKRVWGMSDTREERVQLLRIDPFGANLDQLEQLLEEAALIIPAFGYRPNVVPVYDTDGSEIDLMCNTGGPLVDDECCVLDTNGDVLPGIYGIGLASGFVPSGELGGEPGFTGQTNGLWLYQHGVGGMIFNHIMPRVQLMAA